jgi:VanZ family protein
MPPPDAGSPALGSTSHAKPGPSERKVRVSFDVVLAVLYVVGIFVIGSLPDAPPGVGDVSDKLQHATAFGLLAGQWCRGLRTLRPGASLARVALGGFVVSVGVGGALELWQALLSYRTCDFLDWAADGVGAALAVGFYVLIRLVLGRRTRAVR